MQRTDLGTQREAAAYSSDVGSSLGDSETSEHGSGSDADADADVIIAHRIHEEDGEDVLQYLVKFTDYPIHKSKWLPRKKFSDEILEKWRNQRKEMGEARLNEFIRKNSEEYEAAKEKVAAAKQRRHQKREQMREEAAREKEETLKTKRVANTKASPTRDHGTFKRSKGISSASSARKRRVILSSDDEDSVAPSDDEPDTPSSDSEPSFQSPANTKAQSQLDRVELRTGEVPSRPSSPQHRRRPMMEVNSSVGRPITEAASSVATRHRPSIPTGLSVNLEPSGPQHPGPIKLINEPKQHQRKAWDTHGHHFKTLHFRAVAEKRSRAEGTPDINELNFVHGAPAGIPTKPADVTSRAPSRDNPYGRREPGQRRSSETEADDEPVGVALRSYEEGKIPMACFDWRNGNACPHGAERCRFLHREHDQDGKELPVTTWDGKIPPKYRDPPETCWYWFCEDSCMNAAAQCNYAHKNTGHLSTRDHKTMPIDLQIEHASTAARQIGRVGKYPDVTCWNWFMDTKGCSKSSDQCNFAHRNTGTLGNTLGTDFKPIDPDQKPAYGRNFPKFRSPPHTCYFWLRGNKGCEKNAEDCIYAHENTGWLSDLQYGLREIDRSERPISEATSRRPLSPSGLAFTNIPARTMPPHMKTCFFWNEYKCRVPEENCRSLHRYTGIVADPPRNWSHPPGWRPHFRDDPVAKQVHGSISTEISEPSLTHSDFYEAMQIDEPAGRPRNEVSSQNLNWVEDGSIKTRTTDHVVEDSLALSPQNNRSDIVRIVPDIQPTTMEYKIGKAMRLDLDEMFRCNGDQHVDALAGPNMLVLYDPQEHEEELVEISRWGALHSLTVFTSREMGFGAAWIAFEQLVRNGGSGIIIATPDFEGYASLPGFGDVLRGTVRLWSIGFQEGVDHSIWDPKASSRLHFDRFAIFPHGGIIYITDDVFEKTPQLALSIFEHFFAKIEAGRKVDSDVIPGMYINDGILLWRLAARPELVKWIGDICMNHQAEVEEGDADYVSLEKLYVLLQESGYCEPDGTFAQPADNRRLDFFPIISMRQALAEDVGLYYEARKRSQHEANTDMAHHYSGFVVMERRNYRHYFVVHTNPEMVDWKSTITNIDEVLTPEKCIEYFEQETKGSKFDNYEWAYPDKGADSITASSTSRLLQAGRCDACGLDAAECPCRYL